MWFQSLSHRIFSPFCVWLFCLVIVCAQSICNTYAFKYIRFLFNSTVDAFLPYYGCYILTQRHTHCWFNYEYIVEQNVLSLVKPSNLICLLSVHLCELKLKWMCLVNKRKKRFLYVFSFRIYNLITSYPVILTVLNFYTQNIRFWAF